MFGGNSVHFYSILTGLTRHSTEVTATGTTTGVLCTTITAPNISKVTINITNPEPYNDEYVDENRNRSREDFDNGFKVLDNDLIN